MANKLEAAVDLKTVEFLLDLPEEFSLLGLKTEDGKVILDIETELDVPEKGTFKYQIDDFGNIGLVGLE